MTAAAGSEAIAGRRRSSCRWRFALILLPIAIIVMVIPQWPERQTVATAAAKEAATLYANAADPTKAPPRPQAAVAQAAANYGLDGLQLELSGSWCRGCTVTANVTVDDPGRAGAVHRDDRRRVVDGARRRPASRTTPRCEHAHDAPTWVVVTTG